MIWAICASYCLLLAHMRHPHTMSLGTLLHSSGLRQVHLLVHLRHLIHLRLTHARNLWLNSLGHLHLRPLLLLRHLLLSTFFVLLKGSFFFKEVALAVGAPNRSEVIEVNHIAEVLVAGVAVIGTHRSSN